MKNEGVTAHPLCWPEGWKRTPSHLRDSGRKFGSMSFVSNPAGGGYHQKVRITPDKARRSLKDELDRLGAKAVVMSTNVALRNDGEMRLDQADRRQDDPGVAVYFQFKGKPMVMAQDAFDNVAANLRSLAHAIEHLRGLERHGGGTMMERAFSGFSALPPPEGSKPKRPWWEVMRYSADPEERAILSRGEVEARYKNLAKKAHPDAGGNAEAMAELNIAWEDAEKEFSGEPAR